MATTVETITSYYRLILQREPDAAGLAYHTAAIEAGTPLADIRQAFVTSIEAQTYVDPIVRAYQVAFGRVPDQGGLDFFVDVLEGRTSDLQGVADSFAASPEFTTRYGADPTVTANYIQALYQNALGRQGSAAEVQFWLNAVATLGSGYSDRGDVLVGFVQSTEFMTRSDAAVDQFLTKAGQGTQDYAGTLLPTDTTPPSVALTVGSASLAAGATTTVTFGFSETVTGFERSDVTVTGGTLSALTQSTTDPTIYTATFTAGSAGSTATIALTGDYTDAAGNVGVRPGDASVTVQAPPSDGGGGPVTPAGQTFTLTTSNDSILGGAGNDTINGTATTFGALDTIDGGAGSDTLNVTSAGLGAFTVPTVAVTNVETANITADNRVIADTRGWTGLTQLNVTGVGGGAIIAAATTAVSETNTLGSGTFTVNGGANVSVIATASTTGTITIGSTTAPTGAITVSNTTVGAVTAGAITVTGGTKIDISQSATNAVSTTQTNGAVTINGGASTTEVKVTNSAQANASVATAGINANTVNISDRAGGYASTTVGTITKVGVDGYTTLSIVDNALTDLSLAHGSGNIIIDNSSALSSPALTTTLNLTMNALTGGTLDDADIYTRLNISTSGADARLANITFGALTDLTVGGTNALTLTSTAGATALSTVTVTGQAGLTANLSTPGSVTAINTSATTGASTITIHGGRSTYTGGSGVDKVTIVTALTKAIDLGAGDDSLTIGSLVPTTTALTGGLGTDTLSIDATAAATASGSGTFAGLVTGFEALTLTGATNQSIDLAQLGNYNSVLTQGGNGLTLNNMSPGGTLTLTGAGTRYEIGTGNFAGSSDTFNLKLTADASAAGTNFASTGITASGVENLIINTVDTQAGPTGAFAHVLTISDSANANKSIAVTGNAGLTLTDTGTGLTSVDASGITIGSFTWTSGALAAPANVKGSATGTNTVDVSASFQAVTYTGGSGADTITVGHQAAHSLTGGGGVDHFVFNSPTASALAGMTTIADYRAAGGANSGAADVIDISGIVTVASNINTVQDLSAQGSLAAALNVFANAGSISNGLGVFIYGGNEYIYVESTGATSSYVAGDTVIKLLGVPFTAGTSIVGLGIDGV